jgi:hypothetical protein
MQQLIGDCFINFTIILIVYLTLSILQTIKIIEISDISFIPVGMVQ